MQVSWRAPTSLQPCSSWRSCSTTPNSCSRFFLWRRAATRSCSSSSSRTSATSGSAGTLDRGDCRETEIFDSICFYCLSLCAFILHLQLLSVNTLDNSVCASYKWHLDFKYDTSKVKMMCRIIILANLNVIRAHLLRKVSQNMNDPSGDRKLYDSLLWWKMHLQWNRGLTVCAVGSQIIVGGRVEAARRALTLPPTVSPCRSFFFLATFLSPSFSSCFRRSSCSCCLNKNRHLII